jgi:hypothetical protein
MPDFIAKERERLHAEREAIFTQQQELDTKLAEINREFAAIEAYEAAKSGKAAAASRPRQARQISGRRGSKRDEILQVIKEHPGGLTRGELLERMNLKGDKSGEMSVSNALTGLTKSNQIRREDGKYLTG